MTLISLFVVFGSACAVLWVLRGARVHPLVALIVAGCLIGPHGLGLVRSVHEVEVLGEYGAMLLLFVVGLEMNLHRLSKLRSTVVPLTVMQVGGTVLLGGVVAPFLGLSFGAGLLIGALLSLSSTVVVMNLLGKSRQDRSIAGDIAKGVLIAQDVAVVPISIFLTVLTAPDLSVLGIVVTLLKAVLFGGAVAVFSRFILPAALPFVLGERHKDLLLNGVLMVLFGVAAGAHAAGFSLALGGFIAGVLLSSIDEGSRFVIDSDARVFRNLFGSFFFVAMGMQLDLQLLLFDPWLAVMALGGVVAAKAIVIVGAAYLSRVPLSIGIVLAGYLAQVGEFGLVLLAEEETRRLLDPQTLQLLLGVSVLSMAATPTIAQLGEWLSRAAAGLALNDRDTEEMPELSNHVVICGYGHVNRALADELHREGIPFIVVDTNGETITSLRRDGRNALWGDCRTPAVLERIHLSRARHVQIAISDRLAAREVVAIIRRLTPDVPISIRVPFFADVEAIAAFSNVTVVCDDTVVRDEVVHAVMTSLDRS